MITTVCRGGAIAPLVRATATGVSSGVRAPVSATPPRVDPLRVDPRPRATTSFNLNKAMPNPNIRISSGPAVSTQIRFAHTDVTFPDYTDYRRPSTVEANKRNDSHGERNGFTYLVATAGTIVTLYGAKAVVHKVVGMLSAPPDVLAMGKIEISLESIPEGKSVTFKWRGKPLFIRHRTSEEIASAQNVTLSELRDPQTDTERAKDPKWLIIVGVCTHLGCIPIANAGDFGGYYCPCHGSHYDSSGRIRKGPAPLNLEVPPYEFLTDTQLVVG